MTKTAHVLLAVLWTMAVGACTATSPALHEPVDSVSGSPSHHDDEPSRAVRTLADPPRPWLIAHRGGPLRWSEESMEAYEAAAAAGFAIEGDARQLADGTWVLCHDDTVDRTMTGVAGKIAQLTTKQWKQARIKPVEPNGQSGHPVFLEDLLDRLGGRVPLVIERKAGDPANLAKLVVDRGLNGAVLLQSFEPSVAEFFAHQGIQSMALFGAKITTDLAPLRAAGVRFIGASKTMPSQDVRALRDQGFIVVAYTIDTRQGFAHASEKGFDGAFTDDPWLQAER